MLGQQTAVPRAPLTGLGIDPAQPPQRGESMRDFGAPDRDDLAPATWDPRPVTAPFKVPMPLHSRENMASPADVPPLPCLELRGLRVLDDRRAEAVRGIDLAVARGEIVGVAGVDGSGQRELAEAILGLRPVSAGSIRLNGDDITHLDPAGRMDRGIAYVPEDRHRDGMVLSFTIAENMLLGRERSRRFGGGRFLDLGRITDLGEQAIREHRILAGGADVPGSALSGGNRQKVVLARALMSDPALLVAMQPTRGLDAHATRSEYEQLRTAASRGMAVLLFSLDLDEILDVADRIVVMFDHALAGEMPRHAADPASIGRMMVGAASSEAAS